jgi:hypothetical protein
LPIRTNISAEADPEALKRSLVLLDKYASARAKLYGPAARRAPYIQAATTAGREAKEAADLLEHHERAAKANTALHDRFSAVAQKAGKSFGHLATGVKSSIENLSRYALAPLQTLSLPV